MDFFLRLGAYLFHPLLMPVFGVALYYNITPRYTDPQFLQAHLFAVVIITILIPIISFFLLKNLNVVTSLHLENIEERKYPLMIQCLLVLLIVKMVFNPYDNPELYYFFVGILFSTITAVLLVYFKFKISLHQMAIAGVTMFLIGLSVHFQVNTLLWIAIFFFVNGWVASSRLHTNSHSYHELIAGFFIGLLPQLVMLNFWL